MIRYATVIPEEARRGCTVRILEDTVNYYKVLFLCTEWCECNVHDGKECPMDGSDMCAAKWWATSSRDPTDLVPREALVLL